MSREREVFHSAEDIPIPVHYLHKSPSPIVGIVALSIALGLLAFTMMHFESVSPRQTSIIIAAANSPMAAGVPVLTVDTEAWGINGQPVADSDLLFRLSGLAANGLVIIVEHPVGLSATRLTAALEMVNRAGFSQVGIKRRE